jgi:hypothetical protein
MLWGCDLELTGLGWDKVGAFFVVKSLLIQLQGIPWTAEQISAAQKESVTS